jgi:hypothetical protein
MSPSSRPEPSLLSIQQTAAFLNAFDLLRANGVCECRGNSVIDCAVRCLRVPVVRGDSARRACSVDGSGIAGNAVRALKGTPVYAMAIGTAFTDHAEFAPGWRSAIPRRRASRILAMLASHMTERRGGMSPSDA